MPGGTVPTEAYQHPQHFASSVRGKNHDVCEDAADAKDSSDGGSILFAVADGHGSPACVRSEVGARIAVRVTLTWLDNLAAALATHQTGWATLLLDEVEELSQVSPDASEAESENDLMPGRLAQTIVREWRREVITHLDEHPLTDEERASMGTKGQRWEAERPLMLYGTTLVAGALLSDKLLLLQQGDGCAVVVYADGSAESPLPPDERCVGNVTTSLCDEDAAQRIRFCLVDRNEEDPIACFVATDGVEKSAPAVGGAEDLVRSMVLEIVRGSSVDESREGLRSTLEWLSRNGALDDTSAAGFVNMTRAQEAAKALRYAHRSFERQAEVSLLEDRKSSLERVVARGRQEEGEFERYRGFIEEDEQIDRRLEELREAEQKAFEQWRRDIEKEDAARKLEPSPDVPVDEDMRPVAQVVFEPLGAAAPQPRGQAQAYAAMPSAAMPSATTVRLAVSERQGRRGGNTLLFVGLCVLVALGIAGALVFIVLRGGEGAEPAEEVASTQADTSAETYGPIG